MAEVAALDTLQKGLPGDAHCGPSAGTRPPPTARSATRSHHRSSRRWASRSPLHSATPTADPGLGQAITHVLTVSIPGLPSATAHAPIPILTTRYSRPQFPPLVTQVIIRWSPGTRYPVVLCRTATGTRHRLAVRNRRSGRSRSVMPLRAASLSMFAIYRWPRRASPADMRGVRIELRRIGDHPYLAICAHELMVRRRLREAIDRQVRDAARPDRAARRRRAAGGPAVRSGVPAQKRLAGSWASRLPDGPGWCGVPAPRAGQNFLAASRAAACAACLPASASAVARSGRKWMSVASVIPAHASQSLKYGAWKSAPNAAGRPVP